MVQIIFNLQVANQFKDLNDVITSFRKMFSFLLLMTYKKT